MAATVAGGAVAVSFFCAASPAQAEAVTWDSNWNAPSAPSEIDDANVLSTIPSGYTFLSAAGYLSGGQTVVRLADTAEGATEVVVIGGAGATTPGSASASEGALTADTWLYVTGGEYELIVGGSSAQNYGGGAAADFTGNSHILLASGTSAGAETSPTVDYLFGGNYQDGQDAVFTGDSYISVQSGSVTGSIVGAGSSAHFKTVNYVGNSNVWVYTPLVSSAEALYRLPNNLVVGGNATIANEGGVLKQTGNSSVTIDFSAYSPASGAGTPTMDKVIVGDALLLDATTSTHMSGNSSVSIKGTAADSSNVLFSSPVVGASYFSSAGSSSGSASLEGNVTLSVEGGSYTNALVAGAYIAASGSAAASSTISGTTTFTLSGDTQLSGDNALVLGGSYVNANAATVNSGAISLTISGGSYAAPVVGGSWITAAGTGISTQTTGDISLAIEGGTVSGTVYGGSYTARDNASTNEHGSISVELTGGSILGNVYAGGGVASGAASGVTAASTQVTVSDAVTLGAGIIIDGGVENSNEASSITGNRTLMLSSTNYGNLSNVTFRNFNVVENAADVSIMLQTADASFTKQGDGKLTLVGSDSDLNSVSELTVAAGGLDTGTALLSQGGNGLTSITVGAGASLTTAGLTLAQGAALSLNVSGAPSSALVAASGNSGLSVLGNKSLSLTLSGFEGMTAGSSVTLVSWSNAEAPITLENVNWLNAQSAGNLYELNIVDNALVLRLMGDSELVWNGSSGTWGDDGTNWEGSAPDSTSGKDVYFDTPSTATGEATVTINGEQTPASVVVRNEADSTYTFESGTNGSIGGTGSLTKENGGTLIIGMSNSYSGGTTLDDGILQASAAGALGTGSITMNGGELQANAAGAVEGNALVINGGTLHYMQGETRNLNTAGITPGTGVIPTVVVDENVTAAWNYSGTDGAAALQTALGNGLALSGGGTLSTTGSGEGTLVLSNAVSLVDAGTTWELNAPGQLQFGSETTPMSLSLAEGTTLRVERPQADAVSEIHADLTGAGTLELTNSGTGNNAVQLSGSNAAFAGSVNLGAADGSSQPGDSAVVLLDYSDGSPVGGAEGAELNLNGLGFAMVQENGTTTSTTAAINVNQNTVQYAQTDALVNTFSGALAGAAGSTWTLDATGVDNGQGNTLTGDISNFAGTLAAVGKDGSVATWTLGGEGVAVPTTVAATLSAENAFNEFVLDYDGDTTLSGAVTGEANLTQSGAGTLMLTANNDSSGRLTIAEGSTVQLGNAAEAGSWGNATSGSTLAGAGRFVLVNGSLAGELATEGSPRLEVNVAAGGQVDFGGNEGSLITEPLTLASGSTLTNVSSSILDKVLNLTLAAANIGNGTAATTAMVQFADATTFAARAVTASLGSETSAINLDASATAVVELLRSNRVAGTESFLTLTNGSLVTADDLSNVQFTGNLNLLSDLGLRLSRVEGGSVVLSGTAVGVYIAGEGEDPTAVSGYQNLGAYQAVAIMPGETLTLTLDGAPDATLDGTGAIINNLIGAENSALVVNNTNDAEEAVVVLNNEVQAIDPVPEGLPGDPRGADTSFDGTISQTGGDVNFIKDGAGTLSLNGVMTAHQLTAQEGSIALNAAGNELDTLSLDGGTARLSNGSSTVGTLEDTANGGTLSIGPAASLVTTGESTLNEAQIGGGSDGAGTLEVQDELTLANNARLAGVAVELTQNSTLALNGTTGHTVSALNGEGTVQGTGTADTVGLSVTGTGGSFSGSLTGDGTLTVAQGAEQEFTSNFSGSAGWNLANNGSMMLDRVAADGSNAPLTLGELTLGADSVTNLRFNSESDTAGMLTLESLAVGQGAALNVSTSATGAIVNADTSYVIGSVSGGQAAGVLGSISPDGTNAVFMLLDTERSNIAVDDNGNIVLNLVTSRENKLATLADNPNSATGAGLLWDAAFSGRGTPGSDVRALLDSLAGSTDRAAANHTLAAVAGSGIPVMSSAFAADMERQLRAIRNRTTIMGGKTRMACKGAYRESPRFNAWINGEGDHRKMKADGYMSGYSLSSWGGTVGFDTACSEHVTAGLAFSALYGDLDAHSADNAEGDFDRYYLSAFARVNQKRWTHTFVGSVGYLDADLDRTVSYGTGSYRTHGSTDGWGFGFLYELGYTIPMNEKGTFFLQPVANVAWRHAGIDGYREGGSDAALRVDDMDYDVVTFGAGLRTQALMGEKYFNRQSLVEARALVKVDTGDREGQAAVSMLGSSWGKVRSEKLDAVGVELGAGITIPVGDDNGAIFIDGSAELRNSYSNLNGTVGYRMQF